MSNEKNRGIIDYTALQCRDDLEKIELEKIQNVFDKYRPPHDADKKTKENYRMVGKLVEERFIKRFDPISDTAKKFFQEYLEDE